MLSGNAKDIAGFEGRYSVTDDGRVYSHSKLALGKGGCSRLVKGRWLKPGVNSRGYMTCVLVSENGVPVSKTIHRLVAEEFIDNHENKLFVNHIDGNKQNNFASNLEWVTSGENQLHAYKLKLKEPIIGESNINSKLTSEDIKEMNVLDAAGIRRCDIASKFNVHKSLVSAILNGRAWKHLYGKSKPQ